MSFYTEGLLRQHGLAPDTRVAYHDTKKHKPSPAPFLEGVRLLEVESANVLGVGDLGEDCRSLRAAGIRAIGAGWSETIDRFAGWDAILSRPQDLLQELLDSGAYAAID